MGKGKTELTMNDVLMMLWLTIIFSFQALADLMRTLKPGGWIELLEVKINWGGVDFFPHTCFALQQMYSLLI